MGKTAKPPVGDELTARRLDKLEERAEKLEVLALRIADQMIRTGAPGADLSRLRELRGEIAVRRGEAAEEPARLVVVAGGNEA